MLKRLPSFEPVLSPTEPETVYRDPRELTADESFTVGERMAALVAWRSQAATWLKAHGSSSDEAAEREQLVEIIDSCIELMLQRVQRPGRTSA